MTLVAEGRIALDEPANRYLQKSKIGATNGNAEEVTVRRLGAHASGLPPMFEIFFQSEETQAPSPDMLLRQYGRLAYPPGTCYEYSNIGFSALGFIASSVTGLNFGELMTQRVLTPLGLDDSFFGVDFARLAGSAVRYDDSGNQFRSTQRPPLHRATSTRAPDIWRDSRRSA